MEAERSGPSAVGEISDCNCGSQVGSLWSAIGLFVLGLLARKSMLWMSTRLSCRYLYRAVWLGIVVAQNTPLLKFVISSGTHGCRSIST